MWLWIDCPRFTVRAEVVDGALETLPPILIKQYKTFFGMPYQRFVHQIMHDYKRMEYLIIKEYDEKGFVHLRGWTSEQS